MAAPVLAVAGPVAVVEAATVEDVVVAEEEAPDAEAAVGELKEIGVPGNAVLIVPVWEREREREREKERESARMRAEIERVGDRRGERGWGGGQEVGGGSQCK